MVVKTHRAHGLPVTALLLVTLLVVSAHAVHELTRARVLSPLPSQYKWPSEGSPTRVLGARTSLPPSTAITGQGILQRVHCDGPEVPRRATVTCTHAWCETGRSRRSECSKMVLAVDVNSDTQRQLRSSGMQWDAG